MPLEQAVGRMELPLDQWRPNATLKLERIAYQHVVYVYVALWSWKRGCTFIYFYSIV